MLYQWWLLDLRVFLDLQVSVCELGVFDYLFGKYLFIIYLAVLCLSEVYMVSLVAYGILVS